MVACKVADVTTEMVDPREQKERKHCMFHIASPTDKGTCNEWPSRLKMFTSLLRIKWVANALTSMQTLSKHNSLIRTK